MFFSFGKKKRTSRSTKKKGSRKPPAALIRMCKKHGIKCTRKVGRKRVYKSVSVLKKQLRRKKNLKKKKSSRRKSVRRKSVRKVRRSTLRRKSVRSFRFGDAASFTPASNYGYNQSVPQAAGVLSQSSQVVTAANNANRPPGFGVDPAALPIYGVYRPFFTENVPTTVGPSWNFMGQPDGSLYPVGGPFSGYTSFGKRRRRARFGAKSKGGPVYGEKGSHVDQPTHCKSGNAEKGPNSNWICSFGKRRARFGGFFSKDDEKKPSIEKISDHQYRFIEPMGNLNKHKDYLRDILNLIPKVDKDKCNGWESIDLQLSPTPVSPRSEDAQVEFVRDPKTNYLAKKSVRWN